MKLPLFGTKSVSKVAETISEHTSIPPILDLFLENEPSKQNVLNVFAGDWSSAMPIGSDLVSKPGPAGLFDDHRITWAASVLNGFKNKKILELGPLEGGHSYMLQQHGAAAIHSIESNTRAYLRCLCIKELFDLHKVKFHLGDFREYLKNTVDRFDVVLASGVLYHMTKPLDLLADISKVSDHLILWTHFYDAPTAMKGTVRFEPPVEIHRGSFSGLGAKRFYEEALNWSGFCGGSQPHAVWLERKTILDFLVEIGFKKIDISGETLDHPNGPCFTLVASK